MITVMAGSFGACEGEVTERGIVVSGREILFEEILSLAVQGLEKVHGPFPEANGPMAAALLFGRPAWAIASNAWGGNVLEVTFSLETQRGECLLGKADSADFIRIKEGFFQAMDASPENADEEGM